jgi:hypothetical protein
MVERTDFEGEGDSAKNWNHYIYCNQNHPLIVRVSWVENIILPTFALSSTQQALL